MASYSSSTYLSADYNSFRPHYPASFYKNLSEYVKEKSDDVSQTIDLGCGTGVATYPLLQVSEQVLGLDLSPVMIKTANDLQDERCKEMGVDRNRISFGVCSTEDFLAKDEEGISSKIGAGTVSLITAAECIHWFEDYPRFFEGCAKKLQPNGVLAYWFYIEPVITSFTGESKGSREKVLTHANDIYNKYVYDDPELLGPCWQMPGKGVLRRFCSDATSVIPGDLFSDVKVSVYEPDVSKADTTVPGVLDIRKSAVTLLQYMDYIKTFSALDKFAGADNEKKAQFLEQWLTELESELGWDRHSTKVDLVWSTGYTFMRRR